MLYEHDLCNSRTVLNFQRKMNRPGILKNPLKLHFCHRQRQLLSGCVFISNLTQVHIFLLLHRPQQSITHNTIQHKKSKIRQKCTRKED